MGSVRVEGVRRFTYLARKLKRIDNKKLRADFYAGINRAGKPLIASVRVSFAERLPKSGGLAARVAKSKISTKRRMTGRGAGIRIVGTDRYDLSSINRGRVRHLTFGHKPWFSQAVTPKTFDEPLEAGAPAARAQLEKVMDDIAHELEM